ncbi:MAG: ABC transporter ATP-binding protein [Bacteroidota bacterium]
MALLTLEGIGKTYDGSKVPAVNDVDLSIAKGDILSLLGESGCGKTTLLRLIAGFEKVNQGSITLDDLVVASSGTYISPEVRPVGMVFQDLALFPHLSIKKNILFGLNKLTKPEQLKRLEEVLALTGLSQFASRYPHELSGGQQQRAALARALARKPKLMLLDEPFSSLDDVLKSQVRSEVRRIIKNAGITAILVTHDINDAFAVADQIAVMRGGKVLQCGAPETLYTQPADAYVSRLFGKINLIPIEYDANRLMTAFGDVHIDSEGQDTSKKTLGIRPSKIKLSDQIEGTLRGLVSGVRYAGGYWSLEVKPEGQSQDEIMIELVDGVVPEIGERVSFYFETHHVYLF